MMMTDVGGDDNQLKFFFAALPASSPTPHDPSRPSHDRWAASGASTVATR